MYYSFSSIFLAAKKKRFSRSYLFAYLKLKINNNKLNSYGKKIPLKKNLKSFFKKCE